MENWASRAVFNIITIFTNLFTFSYLLFNFLISKRWRLQDFDIFHFEVKEYLWAMLNIARRTCVIDMQQSINHKTNESVFAGGTWTMQICCLQSGVIFFSEMVGIEQQNNGTRLTPSPQTRLGWWFQLGSKWEFLANQNWACHMQRLASLFHFERWGGGF